MPLIDPPQRRLYKSKLYSWSAQNRKVTESDVVLSLLVKDSQIADRDTHPIPSPVLSSRQEAILQGL
jgi:hypothetical protein